MENDLAENVDELQTELDQGFNMVVAAIERREEGNGVRTDGAAELARSSDVPDVGPSGNGAIGGMLAGGALGLPFGTVGLLVGGVLGGLVGNEIEYRNLKDHEQEKLKRAARRYLHHRANVRPREVEVLVVTEPRNTDDGNWRFHVRDGRSEHEHVLALDADTGEWHQERR